MEMIRASMARVHGRGDLLDTHVARVRKKDDEAREHEEEIDAAVAPLRVLAVHRLPAIARQAHHD